MPSHSPLELASQRAIEMYHVAALLFRLACNSGVAFVHLLILSWQSVAELEAGWTIEVLDSLTA
jgi:hypothetical protein